MPDIAIVNPTVTAAPKDYPVSGNQELLLKAVRARIDGSAATGSYLPAVQLIAPSGDVMWSAVPSSPIAAGGSADVSWFPGGDLDTPSSSGGIVSVTSGTGSITVTQPDGPAVGVDLPTSGVTPGSYGDATHTAAVTVNADGIVTAASQVSISGIAGTGLVKLFDTTLGVAAASIDTGANAIPTGHMGLVIYLYIRTTRANFLDDCWIRFNGDSGTNYDSQQLFGANAAAGAALATAVNGGICTTPAASSAANVFGIVRCDVFNYDTASGFKPFVLSDMAPQTSGTAMETDHWGFQWRNTAAINQVTVISQTGSNVVAGCRMSIFGLQ